MKTAGNQISSVLRKTGSLLFVALFMLIFAIQAFHSHTRAIHYDASGQEQYISLADQCKICDHYTHNQNSKVILSCPPVIATPLPDPVEIGQKVYARIYKFTLQGFTNKGPPSLLS